jgi:hypothetical protein
MGFVVKGVLRKQGIDYDATIEEPVETVPEIAVEKS